MTKQDSVNEQVTNGNGSNETSSLSSILAQKPRIADADTENLNDKAGASDESFNVNFNRAVKNISGFSVKRKPEAAAAGGADI